MEYRIPATNLPIDKVMVTEPLDGVFTAPARPEPERDKNRVMDIAAAVNKTLSEIEADEEAAKEAAKASVGNPSVQRINERGGLESVRQTLEKEDEVKSYTDFVIEGALTVGDDRFSPALARLAVNQQLAAEMVEGRFKEVLEQGYGSYAWDFVDRYIFRYLPFGMLEDLGMRGVEEGRANAIAASTMSPEEFKKYFETHLDSVAQEGFFTSNNVFAIREALERSQNSGYDPAATWNRVFAIADAVGLAKGLLKSSTVLTRIGNIKGVNAANDAYRSLDNAGLAAEEEVLATAGPKHLDQTTHPDAVRPSSGSVSLVDSQNAIVQKVQRLTDEGVFGRPATPEEVSIAKAKARETIEAISSRPIAIEETVDLGLNRTGAIFKIGKAKTGTPYTDIRSANRFAQTLRERGLSVSVQATGDGSTKPLKPRYARFYHGGAEKPEGRNSFTTNKEQALSYSSDGTLWFVDIPYEDISRTIDEYQNPEKGFTYMETIDDAAKARYGLNKVGDGSYWVVVDERLDLTRAANPLDTSTPYGQFRYTVAKVFGSSMQIDDLSLNTLANQGESGIGAIQEVVNPYLHKVNSLSFESKMALGQVFKQLRDGDDSVLKVHYTDTEFAEKFKQFHPKGKAPEAKDYEAYHALVTINDAAYIMQANKIADRYVTKGYKTISIGEENVPAKVIQKGIPAEVFDVSSGKYVKSSTLPDEQVYWRTESDQVVVNPNNVRSLEYGDVFSYNAGGRRINPYTNYFVTLGEGAGRAVLGTFSIKQAKQAVLEIDNILKVARAVGKEFNTLVDELDEVILNNNTWNPSVENTADFVELATKKGWDTNLRVSFKKRDSIVEGTGELWDGLTYDDFVKLSNRRNDDVLMDFGGTEVFNYNPVNAMVDQLSLTSKEYSFMNYTNRAKTAWIKKAVGTDTIPVGMSINELFEKTVPKGVEARRLEDMRKLIKRREYYKSPAVQALDNLGQDVAEWVFDTTGVKLKLGDPTNVLLNLGFQSAFGFMNVFQFFLQSSHVGAIAALSPRAGSRAAAMVVPLRLAVHSGSDEAIRRFAKATLMDYEDAKELVHYVKTSGRNMVEADAVEKGTGPGRGISGWDGASFLPTAVRKGLYQTSKTAKKALDVGTVPFREGERLARLSAMTTAFLEYKNLYKGATVLSDDARSWITRREQDLMLNMTTGSRAAFQDGLLRVPTQWLSHSFRIMETLVLGRGFTKAERIRLGIFLGLQSGLYGLGAASAADAIGDWLGVDPNGSGYVALKYGVMDGIMSWGLSEATDKDIRTAVGTRTAPLAQLFDIWRKVNEESAIVALGGPSAEIVGGGLSSIARSIGNVYNGNWESAKVDLMSAARSITGVDNVTKAMMIMNYQMYTSRYGTLMPMQKDTTEALMAAAGVTNFKDADFYTRRSKAFRDSRDIRAFTKDLTRDYTLALEYIRRGDEARGVALMDEVAARINLSGFSPYDMAEIRSRVKKDTTLDTVQMAIDYMRRNNLYGAKIVESFD